MHWRSDRGAGGEPGNAGRSVRDPGRRRMQNIDAGALVGLVRRKGRAEYMGCRRPWPLQKLGAKAALRRRGSSAMRVGAIGVVQARPRGLRGHASATREAHKGRCGYKGSGALAVTKVGRHSPTPSMEAAEQRAFARSERRRGVREGTGGAGRRAAAWRGRPASPIPALTLQGAGVDGSVTSAGGTGGQPKGSARSEMPGRWRARVLSWMGSSSRRGPQFHQARSEMRVKRACGATACGRGRTSCVQAAWPARRSGGADGACARQAALCARRVANHAPKGAVAVDSRRSAQLPWRLTDGIGRSAGAKQSKKCNLYLEIFRAWKPAHGHPSSFYRDTHPDRVQASRG